MGANDKFDKFAYYRWKDPINQGLFSLHDWHAKMKPFTEEGISISYYRSVVVLLNSKFHFWGVYFT